MGLIRDYLRQYVDTHYGSKQEPDPYIASIIYIFIILVLGFTIIAIIRKILLELLELIGRAIEASMEANKKEEEERQIEREREKYIINKHIIHELRSSELLETDDEIDHDIYKKYPMVYTPKFIKPSAVDATASVV